MPASDLNNSPTSCEDPARPCVAQLTLPGLAFAYAISSCGLFGGNRCDATSMNGWRATSATGVNWSTR
jgi:hypothetical protein